MEIALILAGIIAGREGYRVAKSWWNLEDRMPEVDRAFNKVRNELCEIGLLADGVYLDQIELQVAWLPSWGETGYVYRDRKNRGNGFYASTCWPNSSAGMPQRTPARTLPRHL